MSPLILLITLVLIWAQLAGLGLLAARWTGDYAVGRVGAVVALCLALFALEHFWGLGPRPAFLPFSLPVAGWFLWRDRAVLRRHWDLEAAFGAGLLYCLLWRYTFPNIDTFEERFPDLVFIQDYLGGARLPPPDRWLAPFAADFYYSFQFYGAALLGRWMHLGAGLSYHLAYAVMTGLIAAGAYATARRLCAWRPGPALVTTALLLGGSGLTLVIYLSMHVRVQTLQMMRYLGMLWSPRDLTPFGRWLNHLMYPPGPKPIELPVEPLSYLITKGEFHPPLAGFLVLMIALLLIATLEPEREPRRRWILQALLAATLPVSLIANTWIFPLMVILVGGWFLYRQLAGERAHWRPGCAGLAAATALAFPFLILFMQGAGARTSQLRPVAAGDHSPVAAWLAVFWPLVVLLLLAPWTARGRRPLTLYFAAVWVALLAATEVFYNHDINTATWERFNSTLKWWGWVYGGGVLTLGALNLGAPGRFRRWASLAVLLVPLAQVYNYGLEFMETPKDAAGHLDGDYWLTRDVVLRDLASALRAAPDGVAIDSGNQFGNTDATVLPILGGKSCYVGWPVQEGIWREFRTEIRRRVTEEEDFYAGRMKDPLPWLLGNNIRYVLWLQRDNDDNNARFLPLWDKIRSRYAWHHYYGTDTDWAVGYWERIDPPGAPAPAAPRK